MQLCILCACGSRTIEYLKMEFFASSTLVLKAISRVIGAVNKSGVSEYLASFKISITNQFMVEATNMDLVMSSWFMLDRVVEHGSFCVDAYSLFEVAKKLPRDVEVNFKIDKPSDNLNYLVIQYGKSKFELATLDVEHYPSLLTTVKEQTISLKKDTLSFLIDKTKSCIYPNETRYNINGLLLHLHQESMKIFGVTTDGHRLAYSFAENDTITKTAKITIPKKFVLELKKVVDSEEDDIKLDVSPTKVTFNFAHSRLTTKLIDAEFPDYQRVIPKDYIDHFSVNTRNFLTAIDRVSSIYLNATNEIGVRLIISQNAVKISSIKDINRSFDELPATFTKAEDLQIMCNFVYLKEVLSLIDSEEVQIFVKDSNYPIMVQDSATSSFFYIIMPMKI